MGAENNILEDLLAIKAIEIKTSETEWFTWSSGIRSPIYCDNRLTISYPAIRRKISKDLIKIIKKEYPNVEYIAGTSTAGIPHASLVSDSLNLPLVYVRSEAKKHGRKNQIEGKIEVGRSIVIIEDLISTAGSLINVCNALRLAGFRVLGSVAIFSYNLRRSKEALREAGLKMDALTDYDRLIELLISKKLIENKEAKNLLNWRNCL